MQIKVDTKIFLIIIFFVITREIELYFEIMMFAFFHEMGHLLVRKNARSKGKELSSAYGRIWSFF